MLLKLKLLVVLGLQQSTQRCNNKCVRRLRSTVIGEPLDTGLHHVKRITPVYTLAWPDREDCSLQRKIKVGKNCARLESVSRNTLTLCVNRQTH